MAPNKNLPLDEIIQGNSLDVLQTLPEKSVDLIFADPPYNLQIQNDLYRPNQSLVDAVNDEWDQFAGFAEYDEFTTAWLTACRRVLKDTGTIWVIGSYHNIFRVGSRMMDLGYWILNDVIWHKSNPMPNFRGTRYQNATETLIWAQKSETQKRYTFNYHAMKHMNGEKQMQNVWHIPLCTGPERLKVNGRKAHSTQKPEALLYRVILSSTNPGDVVLDPFFGSGTTGAVAKKLARRFTGIEENLEYVALARRRIEAIPQAQIDLDALVTPSRRSLPRVAFSRLVESGYLQVGQQLFSGSRRVVAKVKADGYLTAKGVTGSIHKVASGLAGKNGSNGWDFWHFEDDKGHLISIDTLRDSYRRQHNLIK